ncbi:MAG: LemA family protein [Alphaproteobacteria bacterium]
MEVLLGIIVVAAIAAAVIYNRLVSLRQGWKNAFADIDVQLKQRADLVPNLVETVKGYATHEKDVITRVTDARATAMRGGGLAERSAAENHLTGALTQLMAVAENYPQLQADKNFLALQGQLTDVENKIAAARRFLNNSVAEYNAAIEQFPAVFFAKNLGFAAAEMFNLDATERASLSTPPKVSFGS